MAVETRFCLINRAATAEPDRLHTSETVLFWLFVTTEQTSSMCQHIVTIIISSATEQLLTRPQMISMYEELRDALSRLVISYKGPMHHTMFDRCILARRTYF